MSKKLQAWQKLDNAATIFPLMSGKRNQNNFRMQVTLSEPVDKAALERAVNAILPRFPQYDVTLKGGFIWYRFERAQTPVKVGDVTDWGMSPLPLFEKGGRPSRINVQGNDIYADFFHAMGDGAGTGEFLKAMIFEYLREKGLPVEAEDKVLTLETPALPAESEDAFHKYYKPLPLKDLEIKSMQGSKAFHIEGTRYEDNGAECVQYTLPSHEVLEHCHAIGCTVTEYLGAAFAMAVYDGMIRDKKKKTRAIQLFMPINLRRFFPSRTLKNFSLFSRVKIDTSTPPTLESCIKTIHESLKRDTDKVLLQRKISTTVRGEIVGVMQVIPRALKRLVLSFSNLFFGKGKKTATFSNVGVVKLPESMRPYVVNMHFSLWPNSNSPYTAVVVSVWDRLNITFNKSIKEDAIEKAFSARFVADKLKYVFTSRVWSGVKKTKAGNTL